MEEVRNARITATTLGVEDHGIFTAFVYLDYGGVAQGFGGYSFDAWDAELERRVARQGFGVEFIRGVLRVAGVEKWEALPGCHVRVRSTHAKVYALGHILRDDWFSPADVYSGGGLG